MERYRQLVRQAQDEDPPHELTDSGSESEDEVGDEVDDSGNEDEGEGEEDGDDENDGGAEYIHVIVI